MYCQSNETGFRVSGLLCTYIPGMLTLIYASNGIHTYDSNVQSTMTHALDRAATKYLTNVAFIFLQRPRLCTNNYLKNQESDLYSAGTQLKPWPW